ncbi:FAD-dependent protein [uncultured Desulfuromusa sp.]|uniref:NAD(P)/FAD-dependent oxidoreductase n=1 Tax=uncultured Desulfuromusa sp. TaxID=219183 RepID=UPI002AA64340|nr:FAD-dependent monooxygenase [uncultured Desulfuromusa sp.]
MALKIREISLHLDEEESSIPKKIATILDFDVEKIRHWKIIRKGIDARRKPDVLRVYTIEFSCDDELQLLKNSSTATLEKVEDLPVFEISPLKKKAKILIAGMGPAGLFSALLLAEAGAQVCLVERGRPVEERLSDVHSFWAGGLLNPESNIQFGEGGAGTFSDGKLTTRLNHPGMRSILQSFVKFGAPEEILWQAKPHIGSDRLRSVLINFRKHLLALGVEIRFSSCLTDFQMNVGHIAAGVINGCDLIKCDRLILALGHSARDTYQLLAEKKVLLQQKSFAVGLRVEHPLELINQIQYGLCTHPQLSAADYRLAWNDPESGRGVYSFCMCPGGQVVNASSEEGGIVVNGMSDFSRSAENSNSALVVSVTPEDFGSDDVLAGLYFQKKWEQAAYRAGEAGWRAPAQPMLEFLNGRGGDFKSSCRPEVIHADLHKCLPTFVTSGLSRALPVFNQRMRGFVGPEATLIGVETRTSAPLRIIRDEHGESISHKGLFPTGEGAGYAGGIMSAALDGMKTATEIINRSNAF